MFLINESGLIIPPHLVPLRNQKGTLYMYSEENFAKNKEAILNSGCRELSHKELIADGFREATVEEIKEAGFDLKVVKQKKSETPKKKPERKQEKEQQETTNDSLEQKIIES